jgi:hypothetical protein
MPWLILLVTFVSVGCGTVANQVATTPSPENFFQVDHPAAWAGDEITLSWDVSPVETIDIELWGFASYIAPQVQRLAEYPDLPAAGTQSIIMPGFPSAAYLIVDKSVPPQQPPNRQIELTPTFYQPQVDQFTVSQTCVSPGDELVVNWATDAPFPLALHTEVVIETPTSVYVDENHPLAQRFENLAADGSLMLTIPAFEDEVARMSLNLDYQNNDYTGFVGQMMVEIGQCEGR